MATPTPKPRKSIRADQTLHPYKSSLIILFTSDLVGTAAEYKIHNPEAISGRAGFCAMDENGTQIIAYDFDGLSHGTIAHESLHCVINVFRHIGQSIESGEEPATYLLQHIVETTINICKKKRIAIT